MLKIQEYIFMIIRLIKSIISRSSSKRYIAFLRSQGIKIEGGVIFRNPRNTRIDTTRPSLVSIGSNVDINTNFQILTHDYTTKVFKNLYGDFVNSSGKVSIGSNIYIGTNVTILKGVSIGDNCIIGAGSIVTKSIPANSVATGVPCKVICSIEEYYENRKAKMLQEAVEYAKSIEERFNRKPTINDFWEEFPLFIDSENIDEFPIDIIRRQLGTSYDIWIRNHKKQFNGLADFLNYIDKDETFNSCNNNE